MIIRIAQIFNSNIEHDYVTETYDDRLKQWVPIEKCHYHFKNAKLRIKDGIVFLVGHSIDTDVELNIFQDNLIGQLLHWNDDLTMYEYVNWVDYFEAYY